MPNTIQAQAITPEAPKERKFAVLIYGASDENIAQLEYLFDPVKSGEIVLKSGEADLIEDPTTLPYPFKGAIMPGAYGIYTFDLARKELDNVLPLPTSMRELEAWFDGFLDKYRQRNYLPYVVGAAAVIYLATRKESKK